MTEFRFEKTFLPGYVCRDYDLMGLSMGLVPRIAYNCISVILSLLLPDHSTIHFVWL